MVKEYLISTCKDLQEFSDPAEVHKIRGRFLHLTSILERIMKDYCPDIGRKETYGGCVDKFVKKLKKDSLHDSSGFDEFVEALKKINPTRSEWAHGIVYYEKRFDEFDENPNNFIESSKKEKTSIRPPYFDDLNKCFETVISWLKKNGLWKIKGYHITD